MKNIFITILAAIVILLLLFIAGCQSGITPTATTSPTIAAGLGVPAKLVFLREPGDGKSGSALNTQPVVSIQDINGNTVTGALAGVRLTITSGVGVSGASLFGPSTVNAVSGVAGFSGLIIDKAGAGYTLTATSGTLTQTISKPFNVSPGAPSKLIFTAQPAGGTAGLPFTKQPEVIVQDHYGNTVTGYDGSVTLAITVGTGLRDTVILGTKTVRVIDNMARFADIAINRSNRAGYSLTATSGSLESAVSDSFTIAAGAPQKLEFTVQPSEAKAGVAFGIQPKVAVMDDYGNVATGSRVSITVSITPGASAAGALLSGEKTRVAEDAFGGLVEYTDLVIDKAGSGYTLTANSIGLVSAVSSSFAVSAP
jgi:hypothetical protein